MTKIEWTDETWNPVWGCYGGCKYCYARKIAKRFARKMALQECDGWENAPGFKSLYEDIKAFIPVSFNKKWDKKFKKSTRYVFVDSMSDIAFWESRWIDNMIVIIEGNPQIIFQILTKFPLKLVHIKFPENVWIGISAENQKSYDNRIEDLLLIEAGKHFVSLEPLHGPVDIDPFYDKILDIEATIQETGVDIYHGTLDWVIVGAETGSKNAAWPSTEWINDIIAQCRIFDIPFFFKGWPDHSRGFEGKLYNEFPK